MDMAFRYVFILLGWISFNVFSAPLTEEKIRSAREIIFYTGSFDPWTKSDQARVVELAGKNPGSVIVVLPVDTNLKDTPLPIANRLRLIKTALAESSDITVPAPITFKQLKSDITKINSSITFQRVISSVPNPEIRSFLSQHQDHYFNLKSIGPSVIDQKVYRQILEDGLYMGRYPSKLPYVIKKVASSDIVRKLSSDKVRKIVSWMISNPKLTEFQLDGKNLTIDKYLASGLNGDAYVVTVDSEKYVLKVAKNSARAQHNMLQAVTVKKWLDEHSSVLTPSVLEADSEGKYALIDLVDGISLDKYISLQGGLIPTPLEKKLKAFYEEAYRLNDRSAIKLDISGDNIFVKSNGEVVLVDFGPTRPEREFANSYEEARNRWLVSSTLIKKVIPNCYASTLESLLIEASP
jgi:predicted Ser/Thr protein kinase